VKVGEAGSRQRMQGPLSEADRRRRSDQPPPVILLASSVTGIGVGVTS
jgi:hypothetical protein